MVVETDNFISGIHNYCDRWCERCGFTARCRVFAMQQEFTDDEKDPDSEAYWLNLKSIFAEARTILREKAPELGIDVETVSTDEIRKAAKRQDRFLQTQDLNGLAEAYGAESAKLLDHAEDLLETSSLDEESRMQMVEIIRWYQYTIGAKIHRGLQGLLDVDGYESSAEIDDPQSDANGSMKVALLAIERSVMAWTGLLSSENADRVEPLIDLLNGMRRKSEEKFPHARDFIRPGFDEIETVM